MRAAPSGAQDQGRMENPGNWPLHAQSSRSGQLFDQKPTKRSWLLDQINRS